MEFNLADIFDAVATSVPDNECIVHRDRRLTYGQVAERTNRLASYFAGRGLGVARDRSQLQGWESGQDHVGLYLYNCTEYLEGMIASFKARIAPFNVNYRYVAEELLYLLRDSKCRALIYHSEFAPILAGLLNQVAEEGSEGAGVEVLIQVPDDSGNALMDGAVWYDDALAAGSAEGPGIERSPDDLYILYTGGTTGMPKGVLWRQADIYCSALGGTGGDGVSKASMEEIVAGATGGLCYLPSPPFMHGAAHWTAFNGFHTGGTIVVQDETRRLDPDDIWSVIEREKAIILLIVGDAFARPLLDQLDRKDYDLSSLIFVVSGGAALGVTMKEALLEKLPNIAIMDGIGSSESGSQAMNTSSKATGASTGTFVPAPGNCVLSADLDRRLDADCTDVGWFAREGRVPLGYLGDRAKTEKTFPVVGGTRYSVPGDRARWGADGSIEVLGRDSVTINSGGEKIFAEEVENAIKHHPGVYDAVVVGRKSERWGQEVVALVKLREGVSAGSEELLGECEKHLARYKLPKEILFLDEIVRSPSGKADYRWAKSQVE